MDLAGHGEDPALVGMRFLPALARSSSAIHVAQFAGAAHRQLAAAAFSGVGLLGKSRAGRPIAGVGAQGELDQSEPRTVLHLRDLEVLESEISDLERVGPLGFELFSLRLLVPA